MKYAGLNLEKPFESAFGKLRLTVVLKFIILLSEDSLHQKNIPPRTGRDINYLFNR
jgi:hypothetical protein